MGEQPAPEVPYGEPEDQMGRPLPGWLRRAFGDEPALTEPGRLTAPPRAVPLGYRLSALAFGPVEGFALLIPALAPMALWVLYPTVRLVALLLLSAYVLVTRVRRYRDRVGILRWGREAQVTRTASRNSGSAHHVPLRQARGWRVDTWLFSGGLLTTEISYALDGRPGTLTLRGMPYVDGVVLADSRHPERAMVVSQFPHPVRPGADGQWAGRVSPGHWVWVAPSVAAQVFLLALTVGFAILRG